MRLSALLSVLWVFGCSDDSGDIEVLQATLSECPSGGVALEKEGVRYPVCDGDGSVVGAMGAMGVAGPPGPVGPSGLPGRAGAAGPSEVVVDTLLCNSTDGTSFLTVFVWLLSDGDAIGICQLNESGTQYSATSPLIGTGCVVESILNGGLVEVDMAMNPPTISGVLTGTLGCI